MSSLAFSVPFNGDPALLDIFSHINKVSNASIREVFLSGPIEHCPSGRIAYNGNLEMFAETVKRIHSMGMHVNLVMNSTCEGTTWYSDGAFSYLHDFVSYMTDDLGIEAITVANPLIMAQVHSWFPQVELCASVLGNVDCVERAQAFKKAGASVITPDTSINRDLTMLQRIVSETGVKLKLMVNEGCLRKCPFRSFHFNAVSHIQGSASRVGRGLSKEQFKQQCDKVAGELFFASCNSILKDDHSQLLKSEWIRPEDLHHYAHITSYFKISGRTVATQAVKRMVQAYTNESYSGDLLDIMDSSLRVFSMSEGARIDNMRLGETRFFETVTTCNHSCSSCGYCTDLAAKVVTFDGEQRIKQADRNFFGK